MGLCVNVSNLMDFLALVRCSGGDGYTLDIHT